MRDGLLWRSVRSWEPVVIVGGKAIPVEEMGEADLASLYAAVSERLGVRVDASVEADPIDTEQFGAAIADADGDQLHDLLDAVGERLGVEVLDEE